MRLPRKFVGAALQANSPCVGSAGKDYATTHYVPWLVNYSLWDTHVEVAERIAELSVELGVTNLVHLGALQSDASSASEWARSKAAGEDAVREVAPGATIVRPADMYGAEDRFLNTFARMHQSLPRTILVDGGVARCQPVFVMDVAEAIVKIAMVCRCPCFVVSKSV